MWANTFGNIVCIYIYIYIYIYTYIHTYIHAYIHACMHTCMHAFCFPLPFSTIQQFSWCIGRETEPYNSKTKRYQTEILDMKGVGMICKKVGGRKSKRQLFFMIWSYGIGSKEWVVMWHIDGQCKGVDCQKSRRWKQFGFNMGQALSRESTNCSKLTFASPGGKKTGDRPAFNLTFQSHSIPSPCTNTATTIVMYLLINIIFFCQLYQR